MNTNDDRPRSNTAVPVTRKRFPAELALLGIFFILLFLPTYQSLIERFNARDSYYSHGFLIPFISIFLVWRQRHSLAALQPQGRNGGLVVIAIGTLLHLIALFLRINVISYFMIPAILAGMIYYLGGKEYVRQLLFPVGFLVFMLPLPSVAIIGISFKMKLLAAQGATALVKILGIPASNTGSTIYYPGGDLLVGDPCSGLRSLISFLALGALFTQFVSANNVKKTALFLSSIAIALLSNIARISFLVIVSYIYGEKIATGFIHDASGVAVFVVGFIGLVGATKLLRVQIRIDA